MTDAGQGECCPNQPLAFKLNQGMVTFTLKKTGRWRLFLGQNGFKRIEKLDNEGGKFRHVARHQLELMASE